MHVAKFTRSGIGNVLSHNENQFSRGNRDNVNSRLSHMNYSLIDDCHGYLRLQKILKCKSIKLLNRKDVNVLCSVVLSAPKNLPKDRQKEFFEKSFLFLQKRYQCPVISAWVHLDEPRAAPHMHFGFAPIIRDANNIYKFRAKDIITKSDLKTLHSDFQQYINKEMSLNLAVINGATANGNKTINELKAKSIISDIQKLKKLKNNLIRSIDRDLSR